MILKMPEEFIKTLNNMTKLFKEKLLQINKDKAAAPAQ
jgi:hypothetical protein